MKSGIKRTFPWRLVLLAGIGVLLGATARRVLATSPSEYEVKAAYLYNFGRFVEWPPNAPRMLPNQFPICVLGRDPFGTALDATIAGEKIDGRRVVARRIDALDQAGGCRVLFISSSEDKKLKAYLPIMSNLSILTVSDLPQFVQRGGMVQFILTDSHVRFEINLAAAQQAGLKLSSELLKVAAAVRGRPLPGH